MSLIFVDETTGTSPLPPGIQVSLYPPGPQNASTLIAQAFTLIGGTCAIDVAAATNYVAVFNLSFEAPQVSVAFTGSGANPQTVPVTGYVSPTLSQASWINVQLGLYPNNWYVSQAQGTMPFGFAVIYAAALGALDVFSQTTQGADRLQSCFGNEIDTWALDFFGQWLPRYDEESDASYYARILAALQAPKCTLAALQNVTLAFYTATALESGMSQSQNLTFDGQGGLDTWGGFDVSQGFMANIPAVFVWDRQSRPDLANQYSVNPGNDDGTFVIQIGTSPADENAWYLDHSHLDYEAFLLNIGAYSLSPTAPDPRLAALINFVKAGGCKPLYATAIVSP